MPESLKSRLTAILVGSLCTFSGQAMAGDLLGFPDGEAQQALETEFRAALSADDQSAWAKDLSARPHHPG